MQLSFSFLESSAIFTDLSLFTVMPRQDRFQETMETFAGEFYVLHEAFTGNGLNDVYDAMPNK